MSQAELARERWQAAYEAMQRMSPREIVETFEDTAREVRKRMERDGGLNRVETASILETMCNR